MLMTLYTKRFTIKGDAIANILPPFLITKNFFAAGPILTGKLK